MSTSSRNMRVFPRPSSTISGVTNAADSARNSVATGCKAGRIIGGTLTRTDSGNETETTITVHLWRTSATDPNDYIDSFDLTLETTGAEAAQANFAFDDSPGREFSGLGGFWFSLQNSLSDDEEYIVAFDIEPYPTQDLLVP